jgi:hypothetical protein
VKKNYYEYKAERHTVDQLAKLAGIARHTIYTRIYKGWTVEQAMGDVPCPKAQALAAKPEKIKRPRGRPRKE